MLKILLPLFRSQSDKIAGRINDEVVKSENRSGGIIFLSKKLKNIRSKNLKYE